MKQIVVNLIIVAIWVTLSTGLARLIHVANESTPIGGMGGVTLWIVGQLLILSPLVWFIWRDRAVGAKTVGAKK